MRTRQQAEALESLTGFIIITILMILTALIESL